jgi:hypothetical protein
MKKDQARHISTLNEMRRSAPAHFWSKADNARFNAYVLSHGMPDGHAERSAEGAHYGGSTKHALYEGFLREAAIATELAIKAVIAKKLRAGTAPPHVTRVRMTHDVVALWGEAGLPKLTKEQMVSLHRVRSLLNWASRYAAPASDEQEFREMAELRKVDPPPEKFTITRAHYLDWTDFDGLYQIAMSHYWSD